MLTQLQAVFDQAMPKLLKRIAVPFTPLWCLPKPLLDRLDRCPLCQPSLPSCSMSCNAYCRQKCLHTLC